MFLPLILRNLQGRPMRNGLTMVGIGTSIAVVVAFTTLALAFKSDLRNAMTETNAHIVIAQRAVGGIGSSLDQELADEIQTQYDAIDKATGFLIAGLRTSELQALNVVGVQLIDTDMYVDETDIVNGRFVAGPGEIVLGSTTSSITNAELGDLVTFEGATAFNVVGIYQTGNALIDNRAIVSLEDMQEITNHQGKITMIAAYVSEGTAIDSLIETLEYDMPHLKAIPVDEMPEQLSPVDTRAIDAFAWTFCIIAVFMGIIGTASIMSLSTSERTKDIGILKAVGWGTHDVLRLLVGEALLLSFGAFIIGSLLGIVTIYAISILPFIRDYVNFNLRPEVFLLGMAIAILISIIGSTYLVYWASRLSPTDALRHE